MGIIISEWVRGRLLSEKNCETADGTWLAKVQLLENLSMAVILKLCERKTIITGKWSQKDLNPRRSSLADEGHGWYLACIPWRTGQGLLGNAKNLFNSNISSCLYFTCVFKSSFLYLFLTFSLFAQFESWFMTKSILSVKKSWRCLRHPS